MTYLTYEKKTSYIKNSILKNKTLKVQSTSSECKRVKAAETCPMEFGRLLLDFHETSQRDQYDE